MVLLTAIPLSALLVLASASPISFFGSLAAGLIEAKTNPDDKAAALGADVANATAGAAAGAAGAAAAAAGNCAQMMVIFARGTTEAEPIGAVVGPPLQQALQAKMGAANVDVQGVPYPADVAGFLAGGDADGSKTMAQMVTDAVAKCPNSKVVMSGYSQGGQLVHNAAKQLDATTASKVSSAVIFGDPDNPDPVAQIGQQKVFCAQGDAICKGQALVLPPHLSYGSDAGAAADFIAGAAGGAAGAAAGN